MMVSRHTQHQLHHLNKALYTMPYRTVPLGHVAMQGRTFRRDGPQTFRPNIADDAIAITITQQTLAVPNRVRCSNDQLVTEPLQIRTVASKIDTASM